MRHNYSAKAELDAMAAAVNYYKWIFNELRPHCHGTVLEVGAGTGHLSSLLLRAEDVKRLILLEPAENLLPALRERFEGHEGVQVIEGSLEDLDSYVKVDVIVCCSVLEHIEDAKGFLVTMQRVLKREGKVLVFVPANPWSYGPFDEAVGHFRRYTRGSLRELVEGTGFVIVDCKYINLLGNVFYTVSQRLLKSKDANPLYIRFFDGLVIPLAMCLEGLYSPPFGQNLFAVLEKDSI